MSSECSKAVIDKLIPKRGSDPCPPVGRGSFKIANVCKKSPEVYYTPSGSVGGFKESIDDLLSVDKFDNSIRKFFMTPKCLLPAGVPTKTNYSTVVVEKLTSLSDYMTSETQARKLIGKYVDFVTDYLSQLQNVKPEDVWMVVSTDFKTDNIMIQKNTEQLFITDFSPMRKHRSGRFYYVTTPIFVFKDDFTDFNPNKVYTDLQISKIAYKISLLCMLTTLMHLILGTINLKKKISSQDALWEAYDMMENFNPYTIKTLTSRQNHVVKFLQTYSEYFDLKTVRKWLKISPFGTRKTVIRRSRSSRQPQPVAAPKSKVVAKGKSMACREFLARLQGSGSRLTNPITGRQILKVGANGKQNPLVKKILQYCA